MNPLHRVHLPGPTWPDGGPTYHLLDDWDRLMLDVRCLKCGEIRTIPRNLWRAFHCHECGNVELLHHTIARMLIHEGNTDVSILERN